MIEKRPPALGEILTELMVRRGFARVQTASQAEVAWRDVAGALADQSRVGVSRRGVLEVVVASSILAQEIGFQKSALVAALQARLPDEGIRDLRVRVGRLG